MKDYKTYSEVMSDYIPQVKMHQGKKHLVVPVIMMVEGVHHGSNGPLFHPGDELSRFEAAWNGIPVVIYHPEENGINISANNPDIIESKMVGRVYNTHFSSGKLKAEAWLEEDCLSRVSPEAFRYIREKKPLDVSVGVFTDDDPTSGTWNGEDYTAISRNHRPDHLALLPGTRGACSWSDGCGVRANSEGGDGVSEDDVIKLKTLALAQVQVAEDGLRALIETIQKKLDQMDTDTRVHFLEEVYSNYFVYRVSGAEGIEPEFYKKGYTANDDGQIEFGSLTAPVVKKVTYKELNNNEEEEMAEKKEPCCPEKVELLVQSAAFEEADRDWLSALEQGQIEKLITVNERAEKEPELAKKEPQMNQDQAIVVLKDHFADPQKFMSLLPDEVRGQMEHGLQLYRDHRHDLVQGISANAEGVYTEDELKGMPIDALEKLAKLAKVKNYSMQSGGTKLEANTQKEEALLPPGVVAA